MSKVVKISENLSTQCWNNHWESLRHSHKRPWLINKICWEFLLQVQATCKSDLVFSSGLNRGNSLQIRSYLRDLLWKHLATWVSKWQGDVVIQPGTLMAVYRASLPQLQISKIQVFMSEISHNYTFLTLEGKSSAPPGSDSSDLLWWPN